MHLHIKRQILGNLIRANRRDLARTVATTIVGADVHKLVGNTYWGKDAKAHFFNNSVRLEQIPQGKRRGVTTTHMTLYFPNDLRRVEGEVADKLMEFAKAVKNTPWKRLSGMLIAIHNLDKAAGGNSQINVKKQKGVHAPDPGQAELPKPAVNQHNVWVDMTGDAVTIRDDTDQNNLPTAFTQGPRAYKMALKIRDQWADKPFREILTIWQKNRIKYHHYMAMD